MKEDHGYDTRVEDPNDRPGRRGNCSNYSHPFRGKVYANVGPPCHLPTKLKGVPNG